MTTRDAPQTIGARRAGQPLLIDHTMGNREVILRPGESLSVLLQLPGRTIRLDVSLTEQGAALSTADPLLLSEIQETPQVIDADGHTTDVPATRGNANTTVRQRPAASEDSLPPWDGPVRDYKDPGRRTGKRTGRRTGKRTGRTTAKRTGKRTGTKTAKTTGRRTGKTTGKRTERKTGKRTERQTGKQSERKTGKRTEKTPAKPTGKGRTTRPRPARGPVQITEEIAAAGRKPSPALAGLRPAPRMTNEPGEFTVFMTQPKGPDELETAARFLSELHGIEHAEATSLAQRMIIPVLRNVSEGQAHAMRDRLMGKGLSCRITQRR